MKNLQKHLQACVSKLESRPILTGVHFNSDDNTMSACDSHRLLRYKMNEPIENTFTLRLKDMVVLSSDYPNTQRLIPTNGQEYYIETQDINKAMLTSIKAQKENYVTLKLENGKLDIYSQDSGLTLFQMKADCTEKIDEQYFNAKYIYDLLLFLTDCGNERVKVLNSGSIKPLLFSGEKFEYLITPIRK